MTFLPTVPRLKSSYGRKKGKSIFMQEDKKKFDQVAYIADYNKKNYDRIELKIPRGMKAEWQAMAKAEGVSLTECIIRRMNSGQNEVSHSL